MKTTWGKEKAKKGKTNISTHNRQFLNCITFTEGPKMINLRNQKIRHSPVVWIYDRWATGKPVSK